MVSFKTGNLMLSIPTISLFMVSIKSIAYFIQRFFMNKINKFINKIYI